MARDFISLGDMKRLIMIGEKLEGGSHHLFEHITRQMRHVLPFCRFQIIQIFVYLDIMFI
jgi:hypothetical protein